jgi:hypothetical protein
LELRHDRVIGIAAGNDGFGLGIKFAKSLDGFLAPDPARDRQVHDHDCEGPAFFRRVAITGQRFQPVPGEFDVEAQLAESGLREV